LSTKERVDYYQKIYDLNETGSLNSNRAKDLIEDILKSDAPITDIEKYASDKGYIQVSDESEITEIVRQVLADNEKATNDLKNGETKVIGFLIGQIMKQSQGKANPAIAQKIINQLIKL
jgi:aspartyl-tRNA(Asn)/glutamyl-tRNA(Gln) amidotransferase subunit B